MRKYLDYILALIPAVLMIVLMMLDPFYGIDSFTTDVISSQKNGTGDVIKIIAIDEKTLSEYGPLNEWVREKSGELTNLLSSKEGRPTVLAYDVMFIGDGEQETDASLTKAVGDAGNVVLATNLVYKGKTKYGADGSVYYDSRNIENEERPFKSLDAVASSGFANVEISSDGYVRSSQLSVSVDGDNRNSFANEIYNRYMEYTGNEIKAPNLNRDGTFGFYYSGNPGEFIHYSLVDVLEGRVPVSEFKDRIVLVGAYAPGLQDAYHSAAKRGSEMYGVEINANIIRALLTGKTSTRIPKLPLAIIFTLVAYAYTFMARRMKMYPAIIIGVWLILAEGIIGRILSTKGRQMSLFYLPLVCIIIMAWVIIEKYVVESINKKKVLNTFKKYMAPQVIDKMARDGDFHIELGGEKREVAVLFVDIRGFTSMSEKMEPETVVQILNQYLTLTSSCIFKYGGMLDKFVGDATMAIFNAPNDQDDYIYKAVMAAKEMQRAGEELGIKLQKEYGQKVSFGIGINVGQAVVGNIGSETRMDYTAIGDTVNTAARLESIAASGEILISENVYRMLDGRVEACFKEAIMLKGKAEPANVYKLI